MGVKTSSNLFLDLYGLYERGLNSLQSPFLLLIRLVWGLQFVMTGWGKWHSIPKVTAFFAELGIPLPMLNAYVVATTELVGGLFLVLGLLGRLTPVPLIVAMTVAYVTSEQEAIQALFLGNPDPFFAAAPFLFLFASLLIFIFGPGSISLDHLLLKRLCPQHENPTPSTLIS